MKKKLIIFDLDGVIIDSKKNMQIAWDQTSKRFNLNLSFKNYYKYLGLNFKEIMIQLKITKNIKEIKNYYIKQSIKNINSIKLFKGLKGTLNLLKKKSLISIVTSKDKFRTMRILKKFNLTFDYVSCPQKKLKSKPYPDQILKSMKKYKIKKENVVYIGDSHYDYLAAKRAGIKFIFAKYGYGRYFDFYKKKIKQISDLKKIKIF
jgi:phosphoglycolate phosphatase